MGILIHANVGYQPLKRRPLSHKTKWKTKQSHTVRRATK